MDAIRYDGTDYIIAKWHSGKNPKKDNSIQLGSTLRVKNGQTAIFMCKQDDGTLQDVIEGPFDGKLTTKNLPVISRIVSLAYHGATPHQAEVYFVNMLSFIQIRFGVPYFDVFDNEKKEFSVPIAVRGTINVQIKDLDSFINLFGLRDLSIEEYRGYIISAVTRYVKEVVINLPEAANLSVLKLESKISEVNQILERIISTRLEDDFGVKVTSLDVDAIEVNKDSKDYRELSKVGKKLTLKNILHRNRVEHLREDIDIAKDINEIVDSILPKIKPIKKLLK